MAGRPWSSTVQSVLVDWGADVVAVPDMVTAEEIGPGQICSIWISNWKRDLDTSTEIIEA